MDSKNLDDERVTLQILKNKQARKMVLVIGTGVSAAAAPGVSALKSWWHCLQAIVDAADQLQVLHPTEICEFRRKMMERCDLLVVAHQLMRQMSPISGDPKPTFYKDCLIKVFDNLEHRISCPVILQAILRLLDEGAMIITTNYDSFLETTGRQLKKPMQSLDMQDPSQVVQWAKGYNRFGVLHINGLYSDPSGIVVDPTGYKESLTQNRELMQTLQNLYSTKSFLFLGCGETLRRHVFEAFFWYTAERKLDIEHCMVVVKKDNDNFFRRQKYLLSFGIKLISYGESLKQFPQYVQEMSSLFYKEERPVKFEPESYKIRLGKYECEPPKKLRQTGTCKAKCNKMKIMKHECEHSRNNKDAEYEKMKIAKHKCEFQTKKEQTGPFKPETDKCKVTKHESDHPKYNEQTERTTAQRHQGAKQVKLNQIKRR
ncbi:protein FAM118A-like isoform X2 [Ambystoma mexicanum]|uniref:protein FAM118A-like isoform X2 n=1 Tax=Ambystoma mexicanum TaxID=8296 RepID=UPI0037E92AB5